MNSSKIVQNFLTVMRELMNCGVYLLFHMLLYPTLFLYHFPHQWSEIPHPWPLIQEVSKPNAWCLLLSIWTGYNHGTRHNSQNWTCICRAETGQTTLTRIWCETSEGLSGLKPGKDASTHSHQSSYVTQSDGSLGHNKTAFGICPVKLGQIRWVQDITERDRQTKKQQKVKERGRRVGAEKG